MLSTISWYDFLLALLVLTGCHYITVLLLYYRAELTRLFRNGISLSPARLLPKGLSRTPATTDYPPVETLHDAITGIFKMAAERQYPPEELVWALQCCLKPYHYLKGSPAQDRVHQCILEQSRLYPEFPIDARVLEKLWER